ncbi:hypothetical protein Tco_1059878 [Tanacetum coccineum]
MYLIFSHMLKSFDREDFETLWKLVKAKYGSTRPVEDLDLILYGDLKTMFEPHVEDQVWKNQQDYRVLDWKLYDSSGVHSLRMQHIHIYILVEKGYPITPATITDMLNKKLQFYGRIVGIKRLLDDLRVIAAQLKEFDLLKLDLTRGILQLGQQDASKQGRINAIDADEEITLVSVQNVDEEMFDVNVLDGEEVFVAEHEVVVKDVNN